jgi:hypothetical protein
MENLSFNAAYCFEINLDSTGKTYLPDIEILRNKTIVHLQVVAVENTPTGKTPSVSGYLTLVDTANKQFIQRDNLVNYNDDITLGRKQPINRALVLPSCFVEYSGDGTGKSITIVAYYNDAAPKYNEAAKSEINYVELVYDGLTRVMFNEERTLVGKKFRNIFTRYAASAKSANGIDLVSDSFINSAYLTLVKGSREVVRRVPLKALAQIDKQALQRMNAISFDFPNSFIEVYGTQTANVGKAIFLNFEIEA